MAKDAQQIQHELFADAPASWHAAIDAGHDMVLVAEAMGRSFEERIDDLQRALSMMQALRQGVNHEQPRHGESD